MVQKFPKIIINGVLSFQLLIGAASAEELISGDIPGTIEADITVATDYVFRGISQSNEKPALQAGLTWSHETGIYAGLWGSSVDYADSDESTTEMDVFIGFSNNIGDLTYDVGAIQYFYPGTDRHLNYDFTEFMFGLSYDLGIASVGASVNYSPDYWGGSGEGFYTASNISIPVKYGITLDGGIGHQTMQNPAGYGLGNDYTDWYAGVSVPIKNMTLTAKYTDTDLTRAECSDGCEARVVGSVSFSF